MSGIHRSYLFVPGNRPERFDKALASGADAVIIDLEDAVQPAEKASARESVRTWLNAERSVYLRINAADSAWFREDLELCGLPGVTGIVLPKAERTSDIDTLVGAGARQVLPLIETAQGMWNASQLARQPQVLRLLFGTIDFNVDMGIDGEDDELLYFRSQLVLLSRVAGIQAPVDGVTTEIDDQHAVSHDTERGRRLGFGAKLCIHPKQVPHVNASFMPTSEQVDWARRVLAAASKSDGAAIAVDGKMVDRPVILKAREILAESERRAGAGLARQ
ncbi:HpcH/HpaI aldolase/citrate lyase family protein [Lacisediminimonas profundi]|uniref:HpcH/HpaI aldolase/citrate lyase family protein n=1 Tax=Lacisediminimonas profundi TaxID=2603856 RepID=UPI00124B8D59|nr:CoA ester lyase [Lacisediminimonas profundi]